MVAKARTNIWCGKTATSAALGGASYEQFCLQCTLVGLERRAQIKTNELLLGLLVRVASLAQHFTLPSTAAGLCSLHPNTSHFTSSNVLPSSVVTRLMYEVYGSITLACLRDCTCTISHPLMTSAYQALSATCDNNISRCPRCHPSCSCLLQPQQRVSPHRHRHHPSSTPEKRDAAHSDEE